MARYIAKTFHGLETVLAQELTNQGAQSVEPLNRAVAFEGDLRVLYQASLHCRTVLRILQPFRSFTAGNDDELYEKAKQIPWEHYLDVERTFAIDPVVHSPYFTHSKYASLRLKDAIVDAFREKTGERPSVDVKRPDLRINLHISNKEVTLSFDTSGSSLHQRGYRDPRHKAPLNEALAAGMVLLSGWTPEQHLHDPMCGTGTLLVEAAMIARNIPPRLNRNYFAFINLKDFDQQLWDEVKDEARAQVTFTPLKISGSDISGQSVDIAQQTIRKLGWLREIPITKQGFAHVEAPAETGMLIMNPPYGERMGEHKIAEVYSTIGRHMKFNFQGWEAWIISSNIEAFHHVGLRPSRKITLFNGALECQFRKYEMYAGSKKAKKQ